MVTDNDILKDFNEKQAYAHSNWQPFLKEAQRDLKFYLGDQWTTTDKEYLDNQRRNVLVFNKTHRQVKLLTGYERKNRLSLKVDPVENSDTATANQLSGVVQHVMQNSNGYHIMSDAFENGALKQGINLINVYMDYSDDPLCGDIKLKRIPYNKFLLDPNFMERDLSDCEYLLRREYLNKEAVKGILPSKAKIIEKMQPRGRDDKYTYYSPPICARPDQLMAYDEYWERGWKDIDIIIERKTGMWKEWPGTKKDLKIFLNKNKQFSTLRRPKRIVKLHIIVDGELMYSGGDGLGLDDFPYVPVFGFWDPEYEESKWKLRGIIRCLRDPQEELNRRRSKMLDIMDSSIATGWKAEEGSVTDRRALYRAGQSNVVWTKEGKLGAIEQLRPVEVPAGLFQVNDIMEKDVEENLGANAELFGTGQEGDISGIVVKLRQGAALVAFQDLFDNYRLSKKELGKKIVKIIQNNYTADKIGRILNQKPTEEFFDKKFGKYDCTPVEGVLSDTQKQMAAAQLLHLRALGIKIPDSYIIDSCNLENKEELKQVMTAQQQAMQESMKKQKELDEMTKSLINAQTEASTASILAKTARAQEDLVDAQLDRVKTMKELESMDVERIVNIMKTLEGVDMEKMNRLLKSMSKLESDQLTRR